MGLLVRVGLYGIDSPEGGQAFGSRAKQFVSKLAFGQVVTLKEVSKDRYGPIVAEIILPDGRNLNHEIVRAGYAWWYRQYAQRDDALKALELEAREAKRGLWADKNPVPPWEWRRGERERKSSSTLESADIVYHGNVRSKVFHRPGCKDYNCLNCTARFSTREDALDAGYRPCGGCKP